MRIFLLFLVKQWWFWLVFVAVFFIVLYPFLREGFVTFVNRDNNSFEYKGCRDVILREEQSTKKETRLSLVSSIELWFKWGVIVRYGIDEKTEKGAEYIFYRKMSGKVVKCGPQLINK
jgi:hypothetical protein